MTKKTNMVDPNSLAASGLEVIVDAGIEGACAVDWTAPTADGRDPVALHKRREELRKVADDASAKVDRLAADLSAARDALARAESAFAASEDPAAWPAVVDARTTVERLAFLERRAVTSRAVADGDLDAATADLAAALRTRVYETLAAPLEPSRELADALALAAPIAAAVQALAAGIEQARAAQDAAVAIHADACRAADLVGAPRPASPEVFDVVRHLARAVAFGGDVNATPRTVRDELGNTFAAPPELPEALAIFGGWPGSPRAAAIAVEPGGSDLAGFAVRPDATDDPKRAALVGLARAAQQGGVEVEAKRANDAAALARMRAAELQARARTRAAERDREQWASRPNPYEPRPILADGGVPGHGNNRAQTLGVA